MQALSPIRKRGGGIRRGKMTTFCAVEPQIRRRRACMSIMVGGFPPSHARCVVHTLNTRVYRRVDALNSRPSTPPIYIFFAQLTSAYCRLMNTLLGLAHVLPSLNRLSRSPYSGGKTTRTDCSNNKGRIRRVHGKNDFAKCKGNIPPVTSCNPARARSLTWPGISVRWGGVQSFRGGSLEEKRMLIESTTLLLLCCPDP